MLKLENNLIRLKFYEGGRPQYATLDTGLKLNEIIQEPKSLKKKIYEPTYERLVSYNYLKNKSFSVMDNDLLMNTCRVFIDDDFSIHLGRIDDADKVITDSIMLFVAFYLKGIVDEIASILKSIVDYNPRSTMILSVRINLLNEDEMLYVRFVSKSKDKSINKNNNNKATEKEFRYPAYRVLKPAADKSYELYSKYMDKKFS